MSTAAITAAAVGPTSARLQILALSVGYHAPLLDDLALTVASGEVIGILGPSGSGKSSLLKTLAGVMPPLSGRILIDGQDVTETPVHARGVGIVFQEPLLFTHLDVVDNIAYGLRRHGVSRTTARQRSAELLAWVGLAGLENRSVHQLSGGQAQRVALARALAPEPAVMLLAEPFSALDTDLRSRLVNEVAAMLRERGCATVYVTHDPDEAHAMADSTIVLQPLEAAPEPTPKTSP